MRRGFPIVLEYPIFAVPRYGGDRPPNGALAALIGRGRAKYEALLRGALALADRLTAIGIDPDPAGSEPGWRNDWFAGLDALALYCLIAEGNPRRYWEIGSGHSTKFARRAVRDWGLRTEVVSIDPQPRADIDAICDRIVRQPLEAVDARTFAQLEAGDILFMDGSHYAFMNSDATVLFLDILPLLRPGVLVHLHDIFLPDDYPAHWSTRYYNEQYMLAAYLLGRGEAADIVFPSWYVSQDVGLAAVTRPIWSALERQGLRGGAPAGGSFWLRV